MISLLGSSTFFVNTYLFYQEPYICKGVSSTACTQYVCNLPPSQRLKHTSSTNIKTLANQNVNSNCQSASNVTTMMEALLLGAWVGLFLSLIISDYAGRKNTILSSMLMVVLGIILVLVFTNIYVRFIGLFLWGLGAEVSFTVSANYIT